MVADIELNFGGYFLCRSRKELQRSDIGLQKVLRFLVSWPLFCS